MWRAFYKSQKRRTKWSQNRVERAALCICGYDVAWIRRLLSQVGAVCGSTLQSKFELGPIGVSWTRTRAPCPHTLRPAPASVCGRGSICARSSARWLAGEPRRRYLIHRRSSPGSHAGCHSEDSLSCYVIVDGAGAGSKSREGRHVPCLYNICKIRSTCGSWL